MSVSAGKRRDRVAVFDSGVGGLSVLREIRRLLPAQGLVYLADSGYGPYGDRGLEEVRRRVDELTGYLIGLEARLIVIACNSASAAALSEMRSRHPGMPFVGMEPAVKPAARSSDRAVIGVMATEATFQGELFASVVDRHARGVSVVARACSGLAAAIETDDPSIDRLLQTYVGSLVGRGADVIVLGCTHYPFVADRIAALAGPDVEIVDPAPAVAAQVVRVLDAEGMRTAPGTSGTTTYLTTGDAGAFGARASELLGGKVIASAVGV